MDPVYSDRCLCESSFRFSDIDLTSSADENKCCRYSVTGSGNGTHRSRQVKPELVHESLGVMDTFLNLGEGFPGALGTSVQGGSSNGTIAVAAEEHQQAAAAATRTNPEPGGAAASSADVIIKGLEKMPV